jgi:hypothetical protein
METRGRDVANGAASVDSMSLPLELQQTAFPIQLPKSTMMLWMMLCDHQPSTPCASTRRSQR